MKLSFKQESGDWQMYVDSKKVLLAPFPGSQDAFVRDTSYEVLYSGPRAVGKTLALLMAYWQHVGRGFGRDWKGVILRPTVLELKEIEALSLKQAGSHRPPPAVSNYLTTESVTSGNR